ncbi:MAG: protein-glutamate O-methyltransferase CheR [Planctomycetes bacterium]|nr:protein-glutamate O-methyltransferase CheR [Planctomycetota bacterium]
MCGLVLGPDKAYLLRHRLAPVVESEGLTSFDELLVRLQCRGGSRLHDAIIEAITTKETSFFRDRGFFGFLRKSVLPEFFETLRRKSGLRRRIRVWSSGCSTGQEPYSIAILIRDLIESGDADGAKENQFTILATDLSTEALESARTGKYSSADVERGLSEFDLARYFRRAGKHWTVNESLRRLVQFRRFDLLTSPAALGAFDLILCRNVLIYFDEATRRRVCGGLFGAMQSGGWLALGAAESLFGVDHQLENVRLGQVLCYRKPHRGG